MKVILHELSRRDDGAIQLLVSCGADPPRVFLATYDGGDPKFQSCSMDEELFMLLSELAHKRFGNCVVYQMEVMGIIAAFARDEDPPRLPATLGRTRFCTLKPGAPRILWNKLWILLDRMGLWRPRVLVHPDYQSRPEQGSLADRPRE
jgi:hypothetical protein